MSSAGVIAVVGGLTIVLSIATKVIGFPDQMRTNFRRKSVEGVSKTFYVLSFITYTVWTLYGILQKDMVVTLAQGLGVVTTGIILYQIMIYGKK